MNNNALPLESVPGVGSQRAKLLAKLGLHTAEDLLFCLPHRHEDRRRSVPLAEARPGEPIAWRGVVQSARNMRWRGGRRVFEAVLRSPELCGADDMLTCRWFNLFYLSKALVPGREVVVFGKPQKGSKGWSMTHPEYELIEAGEEGIHLNRITPVYPLTEGLSQRAMRRMAWEAVTSGLAKAPEAYPSPAGMPELDAALRSAHFPESWEELQTARKRVAFDEFFLQQCVLACRRLEVERAGRKRDRPDAGLAEAFLRQLKFSPTGAQRRVMAEILEDLGRPVPMNRLLQGDVGAGKTLVAVYALLLAAGRGEPAALMAPTEILAEQHYLNLRRWLDPLGVAVGLLTGSRKESAEAARSELPLERAPVRPECGTITVGTHALLFDSFGERDLGLVVIDEQHKFGVLQRRALAAKGNRPDVLVMTATPIPRTLGMTLYGDLDVSALDELPPGRRKVVTARRSGEEVERVWKFLGEEVAAGRQAFVVYPLVEESEKVAAKAVQKEYESIRARYPGVAVGLLHGRLRPEEKESVMEAFRRGATKILVTTPVIEVGVDVPNASVMVIENAERFGLAQLHQLRGRVGRGAAKSYCVLLGDSGNDEAWERLQVMEETADGFRIAEEDLRIRGPGNLFGTEQSGLPPLRYADLVQDEALLRRARDQAHALVRSDPELARHPLLRERLRLLERKGALVFVG